MKQMTTVVATDAMAVAVCRRGLLHVRPLHRQDGLSRLLSPSLAEEKLQIHGLRNNDHLHRVPYSGVAAGILAGSTSSCHVQPAGLSGRQIP